jgi:hypothetical protein
MRNAILSTVLALILILAAPKLAGAQESTCTTVYGGGTVCGASFPPHQPVNTDWGDLNFTVLGAAFLAISSGFYLIGRGVK